MFVRDLLGLVSDLELCSIAGSVGGGVRTATAMAREDFTASASSPTEDEVDAARAAVVAAFRDAFQRGDSVHFAMLLGQCFSLPAGCSLPQCDACMEGSARDAAAARNMACDQRDKAFEYAEGVHARLPAAGSAAAGLQYTPLLEAAAAGSGMLPSHRSPHAGGAGTTSAASLRVTDWAAGADTCVERSHLPESDAATSALLAAVEAEEASLLAEIARLRRRQRRQAAQRRKLALLQHVVTDRLRGAAATIQGDVAGLLALTRDRMHDLRDRNLRGRAHLSLLRYLSVHNDAFFIWHSGPFVTINGCRLGRLPAQPVDKAEINAALGQVALLVTTIANRLGLAFSRYRVVPMGSYSRIAPADDQKSMLELHFTGRMFAQGRMNTALKALLVCIAELGEYAQSVDRSFWWPYPITHGGERIADLHVTIGSKDAAWTRAMKAALTNLKWMLAWAFRQRE